MSKELEMLRNGLADFGRGAGALCFDVAALRAYRVLDGKGEG